MYINAKELIGIFFKCLVGQMYRGEFAAGVKHGYGELFGPDAGPSSPPSQSGMWIHNTFSHSCNPL